MSPEWCKAKIGVPMEPHNFGFRASVGACSHHFIRVARIMDNAIHWINLYWMDSAVRFVTTYLAVSDLSAEWHPQRFVQVKPDPLRRRHRNNRARNPRS